MLNQCRIHIKTNYTTITAISIITLKGNIHIKLIS